MITIVGLGPGNKDYLPPANLEVLSQARRLFLRTEVHPVVDWIKDRGIIYESFDRFYEQAGSFEEVYNLIKDCVLEAAGTGPVVYAVPGHPLVAETSVELILEEARQRDIQVSVLPAMSFLDAMFAALRVNPAGGLQIIDGLRGDIRGLNPELGTVVVQVYSRLVASDVKLALLEVYPAEHMVALVRAAGVPGEEKIENVPLYAVDRMDWVDHLTSLYLPPVRRPGVTKGVRYPLDGLVDIMSRLRGDDGCPWDREQDHHTLTPYMLEETYEVLEAIQQEDMYKICEELGDLLLQIVFHAQIARERGFFDINDVVDGISQKMIRRHPHVFGNLQVQNSDEVLANWEQIKQTERDGDARPSESILDGVPRGLPALLRSLKIQARAARVGFDWPDYRGAMDKVREECRELQAALEAGQRAEIEQETGDALFAVVNVARLAGVDPEVALTAATDKFIRRFNYIEQQASLAGQDLRDMTLQEMDRFWEQAKKTKK